LERSFEVEKKEKAQVFTQFDEDITELDRRASRHRRDIEKVDLKVDKMAEWEEKCQTLTNDLLARVQILEERDADKNGQILELTEKVLELEGRVESMSDKLCHCARPAELVVGDGSAEAPFELEYADEEGSGSSDRSNHSGQDSSEYFEPRQVSVEERSMLRIIEDSPDPAGPSNGPCACTNHPVEVVVAPRTPPESPPSYAVSKQLCTRSAGHPRSSFHPYRSPSPLLGLDMRLESTRKLRRRYRKQRGEFDRRGVGYIGSSSGDETDSWITDRSFSSGLAADRAGH